MSTCRFSAAIFAAAVFVFLSSSVAHALPKAEEGLAIGGALIDSSDGSLESNLDQIGIINYLDNALWLSCTDEVNVTTGTSTNTFFFNSKFPGCEASWGFGATVHFPGLFYVLGTTLELTDFPGNFVELVSFDRASPTAPISLTLESLGFGLLPGESLQIESKVLDQNGDLLFEGTAQIASPSGTGVGGSPLFSFVLDGVPSDVVTSNVNRFLELTLTAVPNGVPTGWQASSSLDPFPLTYESGGRCMELLQVGLPNFTTPASIQAAFGCSSLVPPPRCIETTSAAIAAARDYQKATRSVQRECGRQQSPECSGDLSSQALAFDVLSEAQLAVTQGCLP